MGLSQIFDLPRRQAEMVELVQHGSGCGISLDQGEEIFPLCQIQVWRVELEQRLPLVDEFSGGVDVELLDPAWNAGRYFGDGRLVEFNPADCADGAMYRALCDRGSANAHVLDCHGIDRDGGAVFLAFIDRHHLHAHAILA
jgi:hypothetical protein